MNRLQRELVTSTKMRQRKGFAAAGRREGTPEFWQSDCDDEPVEEWNLSSHSPGQEPSYLGFEELARLQREAGDADRIDEWLTS